MGRKALPGGGVFITTKMQNLQNYLKYYSLEDYLFGEVNRNFQERHYLIPDCILEKEASSLSDSTPMEWAAIDRGSHTENIRQARRQREDGNTRCYY